MVKGRPDNGPRMTPATMSVLRELVLDPLRDRYGLDLGAAAGLKSGTIQPILARLEGLGWVTSHWEEADPREAGRPLRRLYRLTPDGAEQARTALERATTKRPTGSRSPRVAGGNA